MCLSFVPPCITTCIANEDKRDYKRRSSLLFLHTFPTQHAYLYAITEVYVCYERSEIFAGSRSETLALTEAIKSLSNVSGREAEVHYFMTNIEVS